MIPSCAQAYLAFEKLSIVLFVLLSGQRIMNSHTGFWPDYLENFSLLESIIFLIQNTKQLVWVCQKLAADCSGVCALLIFHFQNDHIAHFVIGLYEYYWYAAYRTEPIWYQTLVVTEYQWDCPPSSSCRRGIHAHRTLLDSMQLFSGPPGSRMPQRLMFGTKPT